MQCAYSFTALSWNAVRLSDCPVHIPDTLLTEECESHHYRFPVSSDTHQARFAFYIMPCRSTTDCSGNGAQIRHDPNARWRPSQYVFQQPNITLT